MLGGASDSFWQIPILRFKHEIWSSYDFCWTTRMAAEVRRTMPLAATTKDQLLPSLGHYIAYIWTRGHTTPSRMPWWKSWRDIYHVRKRGDERFSDFYPLIHNREFRGSQSKYSSSFLLPKTSIEKNEGALDNSYEIFHCLLWISFCGWGIKWFPRFFHYSKAQLLFMGSLRKEFLLRGNCLENWPYTLENVK